MASCNSGIDALVNIRQGCSFAFRLNAMSMAVISIENLICIDFYFRSLFLNTVFYDIDTKFIDHSVFLDFFIVLKQNKAACFKQALF